MKTSRWNLSWSLWLSLAFKVLAHKWLPFISNRNVHVSTHLRFLLDYLVCAGSVTVVQYISTPPKHGGTVGGYRCVKITVGNARQGGLVYTEVYKRHHVWLECLVIGIHIPRKKRVFVCSFVFHMFRIGWKPQNLCISRDPFPLGWFLSGRCGVLFQVPFVLVIFQKIVFNTLATSFYSVS